MNFLAMDHARVLPPSEHYEILADLHTFNFLLSLQQYL